MKQNIELAQEELQRLKLDALWHQVKIPHDGWDLGLGWGSTSLGSHMKWDL